MVIRGTREPSRARLAIHRLTADGRPSAEAIQSFLEQHEFPLTEGAFCTFVFHGEADDVRLRHWIFGLSSSHPFQRVEGTNLWYTIFDLPPESRVEYKLEVTQGDLTRLIEDPLNPNQAFDPFGANSVCHGEGYIIPEWTRNDPEARPGILKDFAVNSAAYGEPRPVTLYLPARFRPSRRYPLLVVHDGLDYLKFSGLKTVLDNLIHRLEIPAMVVALTHSGDRLREYADDERHARYLTQELVPALEAELPLLGTPRNRGLMGASFGAVAAFSAAYHNPGFYGRLLLQSGSFAFSDIGDHSRGPIFDAVVDLVNEFRLEPTAITDRLFLSCGIYESLIYENRSLVPLLQKTGMALRYVESRDGHNWENWRDRLREGLSWLFPGPLWMVYE